MKKQTGITMITLIVTIVVMIIIAGTTASIVLGDNRINRKC